MTESLAKFQSNRCCEKTKAAKTKRFLIHCFGRRRRNNAAIFTFQKYGRDGKLRAWDAKLPLEDDCFDVFAEWHLQRIDHLAKRHVIACSIDKHRHQVCMA